MRSGGGVLGRVPAALDEPTLPKLGNTSIPTTVQDSMQAATPPAGLTQVRIAYLIAFKTKVKTSKVF
jgi:hypothetical protein